MPTQLIAIDLDNTLLTSDRLPHPESAAAIRRATEKGVIVVLASGRIGGSISGFANSLGLSRSPRIACNGSHAIGFDGEHVATRTLAPDVVREFGEYTDRNSVYMNLYTTDQVFYLHDSRWNEVYFERVRSVLPTKVTLEAVTQEQILKILMIGEPGDMVGHRQQLDTTLSEKRARLTESEPEYLEVLPPGTSKASALISLCSHLGIPQENTAAIGDYLNDLEMIEWAGVGAAVGNAHPTVLQAANVVVPTNEDGGVGAFIDSLI